MSEQEMQQLSDDEDVAIYIDELKADDPNLKLNAVTKIMNIAKILGASRTRDELIPYLTEIIEECDNDDEFLIKLAENLVQLKDYIGGEDHAHHILTPQEFISSIEEPIIRDTTIKMIKQLSDGRHEDYFLYHLFPMVKRLALWDNYTSKISAAALMPMTYEKLSDRDRPSLRTLIVEQGKDDTPMVRRAIAQILPELCDIYEQEFFLAELQPMLYMFLADDIDSVKMKALEAVPKFGEQVDSDELNNVLIEFVLKMDPDRKNWRVRYHLPDAIIGLSRRLVTDVLLNKVIPFFKGLIKDTEQEIRSNAQEQFALMVRVMSEREDSEATINDLLTVLDDLIKDQSYHVRNSLASVINRLVQIVRPEFVRDKLLTMLIELFNDKINEVRLTSIRNSPSFFKLFGVDLMREKVLAELRKISEDKNWKIRLAALEVFPTVINEYGESLSDIVFEIQSSYNLDHTWVIRKQVIQNFREYFTIMALDKVLPKFKDLLNVWSPNTNYIFRISALQSLQQLIGVIDNETCLKLVKDIYISMGNEKVINVLFNLVKLLLMTHPIANEWFISDVIKDSIKKFESVDDNEVELTLDDIKEKWADHLPDSKVVA